MISFEKVIIALVSLLLLAVPGYILAKIKLFGEGASNALSVLVLYGGQPALMIVSFQGANFSAELGLNMLYVFLLAVAVHAVMFGILFLVFRKRRNQSRVRIIKYASVFSNCGFMGIPFLQMLFTGTDVSGDILIYSAIIIGVFNIFNWTVGVYIMTGDIKEVSFKKIALNPVIISVVVAFLLFIVFKMPIKDLMPQGETMDNILEGFMNVIDKISEIVTPLSMTVIGIKLANINMKQLFLDKGAYVTAAFKLILMPTIAMFITAFLPVSPLVKYSVFFLLAMPCATSSTLLAVRFGADADFASICVLLSTILSAVTIPLLFLFMNGVLGVAI